MSDEGVLVKVARIEERLIGLFDQNSKEHIQISKDIFDLHKSVNEELTDHQNRLRTVERTVETEITKNRIVRDILIFLGATAISTGTTIILAILKVI